ncbi:MAG: FAD-dependent oxidoreductase [Bacilli bacterium]|nr:FAD-dependent oxidoreductase [Bacilli bacterium]
MAIYDLSQSCLSCPNPRCEGKCPTGNHIRDFIALVKQGKEEEASRVLYSTNPFPELTSQLCDHKRQCQGACVRGIKGNPVAIPQIEFGLSSHPWPYQRKAANGKTVACIGAGPASLSAAVFLSQEGYAVEIFEREASLGGAILTGIPNWRFPKETLTNIQNKMEGLGIVFHFNRFIPKTEIPTFQQKYDYVILGIGAEVENKAGQTLSQDVVGGLSLLRELNIEQREDAYRSYRRAYVWGGGNVAMDCARSLKRIMGDVAILYRRSEKEMPASEIEVEEAKSEGIAMATLTNLKELRYDENGRLKGGLLVKMELGEPDASGRASFHEIPDSEYEESFDLFVLAIGEKPDAEYLAGHTGEYPYLDRVYVVGDARYGARNIASAIADGRNLAKKIIEN